MKIKIALVFLLAFIFSANAQEPVENEASIESQFDEIFKSSSTYNAFKVIRSSKYLTLKSNVIDSLTFFKQNEAELNKTLLLKKSEIQTLNSKIQLSQQNIAELNEKQDAISFLGSRVSKSIFKIIFWASLLVLLASSLFFRIQFSKSNLLTKEAKNNLLDVENELDQYRKRAIEKEQMLRRKLQDEVNKQKNI